MQMLSLRATVSLLLVLALSASSCFGATCVGSGSQSAYLNLCLPARGSTNWDQDMNENLRALDALFSTSTPLGGHAHTAYGAKVPPSGLSCTNSPTNGFVPSYDLATQLCTWVTAGGSADDCTCAGTGSNSTRVGASGIASSGSSVALGRAANANTSVGAIAIGSSSFSSGNSSIAIGVSSAVTENQSIAIGGGAVASQIGSVVIGHIAGCTSLETVTIGQGAGCGSQTVSVGEGSNCTGAGSVCLGQDATSGTLSVDTVVIGQAAGATGSDSIGIGANVTLTGSNSVCIGDVASCLVNTGIGIGSSASPGSGVCIGNGCSTSSLGVAIGGSANGSSNGVCVGASSTTSSTDGVAIGQAAGSSADGAIAIGQGSGATAANSICIGEDATCIVVDGIGIGAVAAPGAGICIAQACSGTSNAIVFGSPSQVVSTAYFGDGITDATPSGITITPTGASGANVAGANEILRGSPGTGTGLGGQLRLAHCPAGGAGSSANACFEYFRLEVDATSTTPTLKGINSPDIGGVATADMPSDIRNKGYLVRAPTAQSIIAVGNTITAIVYNREINADANYTLTSTPTIADGEDGQEIKITNVDSGADCVTLQDEAGLAGSNLLLGAVTRQLCPQDKLHLTFNLTLGAWVEDYFANN